MAQHTPQQKWWYVNQTALPSCAVWHTTILSFKKKAVNQSIKHGHWLIEMVGTLQ